MSEKGKLIYIPSSVTLYQFSEDQATKPVVRYKKLEKPMNVLVLDFVGQRKDYVEVLCDSERWWVKSGDYFLIGDKQC